MALTADYTGVWLQHSCLGLPPICPLSVLLDLLVLSSDGTIFIFENLDLEQLKSGTKLFNNFPGERNIC